MTQNLTFPPETNSQSIPFVRSRFAAILTVLAILLQAAMHAQAPAAPAEAYGPFNAVFLADGPGLNKPLSPWASLDGLAEVAMDQQGSNGPVMQDPLLGGRAPWTLVFWFQLSEPVQGRALLAGIGDPAGEDARFIGMDGNRLGLWLGHGKGADGLVAGGDALDPAKWHLAAAVSDGEHVTLYADRNQTATSTLAQGSVAPMLAMGPEAVAGVSTAHFGGKIAGLKIYRVALTAGQVKAIADAPPDFDLPAYEEASQRWPVQTRSQAGYAAPQDPATMPRGKGEIQKPAARKLRAEDLHCQLAGTNPWKLEGG
jgi:hypothetical protein